MNAEIICVGTELLLGDIVNTNARYISKELAALGINVYFQTVVGDNEERLAKAFEIAFGRADLVVTSGGLGPTEDDLTKETAAIFFNKKLALNEEVWANIQGHFAKQHSKFTMNNKKQAYFSEGSEIIPNSAGTAPGCIIEENGKILIMLPGPPSELLPMFEKEIIPRLKKKTNISLYSRTLRICGIGESTLCDMLADIIGNQSNPTIAPYAKTGEVHLRITASATEEDKANTLIGAVADEIYRRIGDNIYAEDDTTLEQTVVNKIRDKGMTLACAESCTGGLFAAQIINCPGASEVFNYGMITYSNQSKMDLLNVGRKTLDIYGAVSAETAKEMAEGATKTAHADIGVSITGIAGPSGGSKEKPVGLVYIGLCIKGKTTAHKFHFSGDRNRIRTRTVISALNLLRRELQ